MIWHSSKKEDVVKQLETDPKNGLSSEQVNARLAKYGPNQLTEKKKKSFVQLFAAQCKDATIIVLLIAALLSLITTLLIPGQSALEPVVIVLIVAITAAAGVVRQSRAEAAIEGLKMLSPPSASVLRNGSVSSVPATNIVPGDIILLSPGSYIPADARLLEARLLHCDESALTGDSIPTEKTTDCLFSDITTAADQKNMVFCGCSVESGEGKAVVTDTGRYTEIGKMTSILGEDQNATKLQKQLLSLGRGLGFAAVAVCVFIFVFGMIFTGGQDIFSRFMIMFMTSVALAVAAVPQGLPAIAAGILAAGVKRMIRKKVVVRSLSPVEALGSTTVVCTDKTGTLTHNTMTVTQVFNGTQTVKLSDAGELHPGLKNILLMAAMCCDASAEVIGGKTICHGDPTEAAIVAAAIRYADVDKATIESMYPRLCGLPFDPGRKLMTTVNMIDAKPVAVVKGAPDVILSRCEGVDGEAVLREHSKMASQGLRVIGIAFKALESQPANPTEEELENGLVFAGLIGISDPPRNGAREAVRLCQKAGVKVVMITGDHVDTAVNVAKDLGILTGDDRAATGEEVAAMSDEQLLRSVDGFTVYARVSPEDKTRIIKAWQKRGEVVSLIADGIGDAVSLKTADIGCAVESASDVAKSAADVIFTSNRFDAMADAISESRGVFAGIRRAVGYLLSCNLGEVLVVLLAMLFWQISPLYAIQLLWINMITSGLPALSIGMESPSEIEMHRKPRQRDESIFDRRSVFLIVTNGILFAILSLIAFLIGDRQSVGLAGTMAFAVLAFSQLMASVSMRSERSFFHLKGRRFHPYFLAAFLLSVVLVVAVLTIPPLMRLFRLSAMSGSSWLTVIGLSLIPFVIWEAVKAVKLFIKKK